MHIYWNKKTFYNGKDFNSRRFFWNTSMANVSLSRKTNKAAVTSCENAPIVDWYPLIAFYDCQCQLIVVLYIIFFLL